MTLPGIAVVQFPTPDPVEDCLRRGVFAWDCGDQTNVLRVERFGKKLLNFSTLST